MENLTLVVVSKVKKYIKEKAQMNTSASTMEALTQRVSALCDKAIENAKNEGRKTVMDRDVPALPM
jgi:histone H3/H4